MEWVAWVIVWYPACFILTTGLVWDPTLLLIVPPASTVPAWVKGFAGFRVVVRVFAPLAHVFL